MIPYTNSSSRPSKKPLGKLNVVGIAIDVENLNYSIRGPH